MKKDADERTLLLLRRWGSKGIKRKQGDLSTRVAGDCAERR